CWMFESDRCCRARLACEPVVALEQLWQLRELLRHVAAGQDGDLIQDQHSSSQPKGDADAQEMLSPAGPVGSDRAGSAAANLVEPTCGSTAESNATSGSSATRTSDPRRQRRPGKGGRR